MYSQTLKRLKPEVDGALESYHILGLRNISSVVDEILCCKCLVQQSVLDFIEYCSLDNRVNTGLLCELYHEWKTKKMNKQMYHLHLNT